jgi:hypothetical protein
MGFIRAHKTKDYTVMSNHHLNNCKLSLKSKGLLSFMLSKPDDWSFSINGLKSQLKEGRDGISSSLKELEDFRYLIRGQIRYDNGSFKDNVYHIFEKPTSDIPMTDNPISDNPIQVSTKEVNTKIVNTKTKKEIENLEVEFEEILNSNQLSILDQIKEQEKSSVKKEVSILETKFNFRKEMINLGFREDLVLDWMEVRRKLKATNTKTSLNGFLREVNKTGEDKNKILELCAERGWKGFRLSYWTDLKKREQPVNGNSAVENLIKAMNVNQ